MGDVPEPKLAPSVAQIVSKLEDEEEHVQRGALEIVVAYMRALGNAPRAGRRTR